MDKGFRKSMSKFLVITVIATGIATGKVSAKEVTKENPIKIDKETLDKVRQVILDENKEKEVDAKEEDPYKIVRVIVEVSGQTASDMAGNGKASIDDIKTVKNSMNNIQSQAMSLGGKVRNVYGNIFKGFSVEIQRGQIGSLKDIAGVISAKEATIYNYPKMSSAKEITDIYKAWANYGYKGEGTVVSIIDTGIDYNHKDMRLTHDSSQSKLNEDKVREIIDAGVLRAGKSLKNKRDIKGYYTEKVPFGFNYADDNEEVIDKQVQASMHGMHVAGIVGANGKEDEVQNNDAVQGVAPEAQLLAMKVFSNGPVNGASADDVIAAIEDSVTLGVDVINMSLGSTAGFSDSDDPENKAVNKAVEKGVIVVVASGNESYSTAPFRDPNINDTGTSGLPATAKGSISVANYANSSLTLPTISVLDENGNPVKDESGKECKSLYVEEAVSFKRKSILSDIVDAGLGTKEEFEKIDVKGKVALIKRSTGVLEKAINAVDAGASGIIMYNHEMGGERIYTFPEDDRLSKVNAVFIGNKAGAKISSMLKEGKKPQVKIASGYGTMPSANANDFAGSSSWGCGPDLSFKPQISAPGYFIHSTLNNNDYGLMAGTSMASPHIAGAMAVVKERVEKELSGLEGKDLVDFARNSMMNTAKVEYETPKVPGNKEERPFSPRRQGAGMLQLNNAIKNKVIASHKGEGAVELKEIQGNKVKFEIELTNYGNKEVEYDLGLEGDSVLANYKVKSSDPSYQPFDVALSEKEANVTFDKNTVKVEPNGKTTVEVTLNIGSLETERFLEGFIKFNSNNEEVNPNLTVPFMGYYGDWTKERILNDWVFEEDSTVFSANDKGFKNLMLTEVLDSKTKNPKPILLGNVENGTLKNAVISPNKDNMADVAIPYLYFLRNAKYASVELVKNGNVIGQVGYGENLRKHVLQLEDGSGQRPKMMRGLSWDGTYYDSKSGKYVVAKDGDYELHYKLCVDLPESKPQEYTIPIKVDTTAPTLEITSPKESKTKEYNLTWTASDEGSKISGTVILVNGAPYKAKIENKDGVFSTNIVLKENLSNEIVISTYDQGFNIATSKMNVVQGAVDANVKFDNIDATGIELTEKNFTDGIYQIKGHVNKDLKSLIIGGENITIKPDSTFEYNLNMNNLKQGTNYLTVKAVNNDGSLATIENAHGEFAIKVYFDTEAPVLNITSPRITKDDVVVTKDGNIELKGDVADSAYGYTFLINGKVIKKVATRDSYGLDKTRYNFDEKIKVENGDKILIQAIDLFDHETSRTLTVKYGEESKIQISGVENGKAYKIVKPSVKAPRGVKIEARLNGKPFLLGLPIIREGNYVLNIVATDRDGEVTEEEVNFKIDRTAPKILVKGIENNKTYKDEVTPIITTDEEDVELSATLNGKEYEIGTPIKGSGKYDLRVEAKDAAGNVGHSRIKFKLDSKGSSKKDDTKIDNPVKNDAGVAPIVSGISKDKKFYNTNVSPIVTVAAGTEVELLLNDNPFESGTKIKDEGEYTLKIKTTDVSGNVFEDEYNFVIDKTPIKFSVKGIKNNGVYNKGVTATLEINEEEEYSVSAVLKSGEDKEEAYEMGTEIEESGEYTLEVTVKDNAGNESQSTIKFTINGKDSEVKKPEMPVKKAEEKVK